MGLVLFAILFLFGATGMERRRAIGFCIVTSVLLFVWAIPVVIEQARPYGKIYLVLEPLVTLVAAFLFALLFYFAGRWTRSLLKHVPRISRAD